MALWIAAALFCAYLANVALGAVTGAPLLNDVAEMILLWMVSIAFVVAILKRERAEKERQNRKAN